MKRFFIGLMGGTVLLIGVAMIILPGPAVAVIPAGLAILGTEFIWARRALRKCRDVVQQSGRKFDPRLLWRRSAPDSARKTPQ